jgi:hypothetical protein
MELNRISAPYPGGGADRPETGRHPWGLPAGSVSPIQPWRRRWCGAIATLMSVAGDPGEPLALPPYRHTLGPPTGPPYCGSMSPDPSPARALKTSGGTVAEVAQPVAERSRGRLSAPGNPGTPRALTPSPPCWPPCSILLPLDRRVGCARGWWGGLVSLAGRACHD